VENRHFKFHVFRVANVYQVIKLKFVSNPSIQAAAHIILSKPHQQNLQLVSEKVAKLKLALH
jgi:hypothetical protein